MARKWLVICAAIVLAGCDGPPPKPPPAVHTGPTIQALPFTIKTVMLSDLFINQLKVAKVNVEIEGGTQEEWAATALAIAYAVGNLGANSIEATVDRSDLGEMDPKPPPMFFHLARVSFSPDPKHTVWDNMPQTSISVTETPATREEVQRDDEFEALVEKNNDKGMESDAAENKAAATIAKKYHLPKDWQLYSGGLDETKFPKADYNVDSSRAANSLAALDACMRGKIIRFFRPCP
jgi:hypothetical protein